MNEQPNTSSLLSLARFAKLVVAATFGLIFVGGQTTTSGAGMAFADWPLSNGSLNPAGWWQNSMMRLEHGHRLMVGVVATLICVLFVWICGRRKSLPKAAFSLGLWAVIGVFAQALLGGLRVILDPQGIAATTTAVATTFRILHGCMAQIELCLVVSLAAVLSPVWQTLVVRPAFARTARIGWVTAAFIFLQLIVGAAMRHLGVGLVIPSYPLMPDGAILPKVHNAFIDLNFTHTRVLPILVAVHVVLLARRTLVAREPRLWRPAVLLLLLLAAQITLGMFVIWHLRPPILTTIHVVNGAALLATTILIVVRAGRSPAVPQESEPVGRVGLTEAAA